MDGRNLAARLEAVPELRLQAVALILDIESKGEVLSTEDILLLNNEIEQAVDDLENQAKKVAQLCTQCRQLLPIPSRTLPPGF